MYKNVFKKAVAMVAIMAMVVPYIGVIDVSRAEARDPIVVDDGTNHGSVYGGGDFENSSYGIRISSGSLDTVSNVDFLNNVDEAPHTSGAYITSYGTGVYVENGLISKINNVTFKNNITKSWNNNAGGAAITTLSGGNINEIRDSYFEGNQAIAQGNEGFVYPDNPTFTGINAGGGAITTYSGEHNMDPAATASSVDSVTDTSFKNNAAINNGYIPWSAVPGTVVNITTEARGGAVTAQEYAFTVNANRKDVVFEGNKAINNGGATDQNTGAYGGAIFTANNTLTLNAEGSNISFKDNIATDNTGHNERGNAICAENANVVLNSNSGKKIYFDENQDIFASSDSTVYIQGSGQTELSETAKIRGAGKLDVTNDGTLYTTTAGINDIATIENDGTMRLYGTGALTRAIDGDGKLKIEGDIENQTDITQERLIIDSGASLNDNGLFIIADKITNDGLFTLNGDYYKADIDGYGTLNITKDTHLVGSINLDDTNITAGKQLLLDGSIISSKYVAQGKQNKIGGENIAVYGTNNSIAGSYSTAVGQYNNVSGSKSLAVGYKNTVSGDNSGAFGDPNYVSGNRSYAIGNDNNISNNDTFVLGSNVTTTQDNSVILGNNSTDKAATTVTSDTINGKTYTYATTNATGVVSVGAAGAERQIINVANGEVSATSTDAVNGSQLYQTQQSIRDLGTGIAANLGTAQDGTYISAIETVNANIKRLDDGIGSRVTDGNIVRNSYTVNQNIQAIDSNIGKAQDGTYIKKDNTVNDNLKSLDDGLTTEKTERVTADTGLNKRIDELSSQTSGNIDALAKKTEAALNENARIARQDTSRTGANAAALAGLRPLDWNPEDKWNVSVGTGLYRGETAYAAGVFYRPSENSMVNVATSFGTGEVMLSGGLSFRLGKGKNIGQRKVLAQSQEEKMSQRFAGQTAELRRAAFELSTANEKLERKTESLSKADKIIAEELIALKKYNQSLENKLSAVIDELKALRSAQTAQAQRKETAVRTQLQNQRAKAEQAKAEKVKAEVERQAALKAERQQQIEQAKAILAQKEAAQRAEFERAEAEAKARREEAEQARRIRIAQEQELMRRQYDEQRAKEKAEAERIAREKKAAAKAEKEQMKLNNAADLDAMSSDGLIEEAKKQQQVQAQQRVARQQAMPVAREIQQQQPERVVVQRRVRNVENIERRQAMRENVTLELEQLLNMRVKLTRVIDQMNNQEIVLGEEAYQFLVAKIHELDKKIGAAERRIGYSQYDEPRELVFAY